MRSYKNICKKIACIISSFSIIGCSALTPAHQTISVTTNVPDAQIFVNSNQVGYGNISTSVKRNKHVDIMAYKEGYTPAHKSIGKHNNVQGCLDAVVCGLGLVIFALPWCISAFATPGAWSLDEKNVALILLPTESKQ